jgi:pyridoxine 5'-phosphate synthase PdxJ
VIALSVNLNKIALIRNSRDTTNPDVPEHARMVLAAGADGITVHPRPDQRHIRASDCFELADMLAQEAGPQPIELNIEGNPFAGPRQSERPGVSDYPGFMELIEAIKPAQCTLVPDGDAQLTSDHGFDLTRDAKRVEPLLQRLRAMGVMRQRVKAFARESTALGRFAPTAPLAQQILNADDTIDAVLIVTREITLDPESTLLVAHDEQNRHERTATPSDGS